ncbi:hypothetical protein N0V93_004577 [Gnomoniopsis smithogilvyi]|uniref:Cobalamin-independent methionine synthase MetE C-terminal/archaeal domain-containing protein n=1 Tax=Gnomoniopsis smithogilvyi TaxID=1191159 RepID=A0A9W9CWB7_9PEZI|nr:hypothetical protein N0V93_004577 [Gnomoniopsis smithogilvyi]
MAPLFRNDQIGSLIRPDFLIEARTQQAIYSENHSEDLQKLTQTAISSAVRKQLELGIRPIVSGEYERTIFYSGFFERLEGFECRTDLRVPEDVRPALPIWDFYAKVGRKYREACLATGKIRHTISPNMGGWNMLKEATPKEHWKDCKISIPAITWEHLQLPKNGAYSPGVYASDREYFTDLAAAYRKELQELYDAGLRSVQFDDPNLSYFIYDNFLDGLRKDGVDPDELLDLYVWAHNEAIKDRPKDMHIGVHICKGNVVGTKGFVQGSYERIAEKVLTRLNHDTFYLEFDDLESSFEGLKFIPEGKNIVLGLVTTKTPELEDVDVLVSRVHQAAEVIAKGQGRTVSAVIEDTLGVSPQCGFSSHSKLRGVGNLENMWKKLVLVRDITQKVWS